MKVRIYQINKELDTESALFMGFDFAEKHGGVDPSTYMCVFDGSLDFSDIEEVYALCNAEHPIGYYGHSLSVSDIVETDDGCYFCDSIGFKKLADFDSSKAEPLIGRRMIVIEPHKASYEAVIPDELESLQKAVGGYIEITYPFEDNAIVILNEESKLIGMDGNRRVNGQIYAGPMLISADDGSGELTDLTNWQIAKYTEIFRHPEEISREEVENDTGFAFYSFG